jgi:hypothetical protein
MVVVDPLIPFGMGTTPQTENYHAPRQNTNVAETGGAGRFFATCRPVEKKTSELTLDLAVRLLKAALPRPELTVESALAIVAYHLRRNEIARRCHTKTWKQRHPGVEVTPLWKTKNTCESCESGSTATPAVELGTPEPFGRRRC